MSQETAQEAIDRLKTFYAETGSRWILWSAWPTPDPAPFGFQSVGKPPLMIRPAGVVETVLPAGLHIEEVVDEAGMVTFERTFSEGYGLTSIQSLTSGSLFPGRSIRGPLRCWVGFRRGEPVTVAAACAYAGVVGVYCVATLPHARGRGYGAAITAVAAGIDPTSPVVLQASDSGYPVYRQLGAKVGRVTSLQADCPCKDDSVTSRSSRSCRSGSGSSTDRSCRRSTGHGKIQVCPIHT